MSNLLVQIFSILCLATQTFADCQDLTFDDCRGKTNKPPFQSLKLESEDTCQKYCSNIFPGVCSFFIYDRQQNICQIYDYDPEDYAASCNIIGGTPTPSLVECDNSNEECLVSMIDLYLKKY